MTLPIAVAAGLGTSITALVTRAIGESDRKKAAVSAVQAIYIGLAVSVLIGVPLLLFAPQLLKLLGGDPSTVRVGSLYARITLGTSGVVIMLSLINAIFRGAGDAAIAMRLL